LGHLLGYGLQTVDDSERSSEYIILAEALNVDVEDWEALSDDEREFILKDAREKLEFFLRQRGGR
jgi:hypothetical protein